MKPVTATGVFVGLLFVFVQNSVDPETDAYTKTNDFDTLKMTGLFSGTRSLLQGSQDFVVSVSSEEELRNVLSVASLRSVIRLDMAALTLSGPIVIDGQNVTLEGRVDTPTVLRCPENTNESAIVIRDASVRLRFLNITQCRGQSAVAIQIEPSISKEHTEVAFEDVHFWRNGEVEKRVFGAAVNVDVCGNRSCPKPFVRFQSCRFLHNRGTLGGAIYARNAHVDIRDSDFEQNEADLTGGAVYLRHTRRTTLTIERSRFQANRALGKTPVTLLEQSDLPLETYKGVNTNATGGAIFIASPDNISITLSSFENNEACGGGGGIAVIHSHFSSRKTNAFSLRLSNSLLRDNAAYCGPQPNALKLVSDLTESRSGGALLYDSINETNIAWNIRNCTFEKNRAIIGGGLAFRASASSSMQHRIINCQFTENVALRGGGSIFVGALHLLLRSTNITRSRSFYAGGIFARNGASLTIDEDLDNPDVLSVMEECVGVYGGAMVLMNTDLVNITSLILKNNTAYRQGGGLYALRVQRPIVLQGVQFEGNIALIGGGFSARGVTGLTITSKDRPTNFRDNSASIGGGLCFETMDDPVFAANIREVSFISNEALSLQAPKMRRLLKEGADYIPLSSAMVSLPNQTEQFRDRNLLQSLSKIPVGSGGGACMSFLGIGLYTIAQVTYANVFMMKNAAIVGGGLSVHAEDSVWNREETRSCFPSIPGFDTCQKFDIHNITITQNTAERVGGVFLSQPDAVAMSCGPGKKKWMASRDAHSAKNLTDQLLSYCSVVDANNNTDGSDNQAQVGTNAVALHVEGGLDRLTDMVSGETLRVPCRNEEIETTCPLRIEVKDAFNQTIGAPIDDAGLDVTLESEAIAGDLRYTSVNGVCVIDNTRAHGINTIHTLAILSQQNPNVDIKLQISTRGCHPGEIAQRDVCDQCPVEWYGFNSMLEKCQGCETHARCSGGSVLIPDDGYWHSTPFSPVFRKCIHLEACRYDGRAEILTLFYKDPVELHESLEELDAYLAEEGPKPDDALTYPQCSEGYKGLLCGSCRTDYGHSYTGECESCPAKEAMNGLLIFLVALWLFVFISINCAISVASMKSRVELVKLEVEPLSTSFKGAHRNLESPAPETVSIAELLESARIASIGRSIDLERSIPTTQHLTVTLQWTETLKIFINYLQLTGIAIGLKIEWRALLKGMLKFQAALGGLATVLITAPYECHFKNGTIPASIAALWMRLATPWIVHLAIVLVVVLYWIRRSFKTQQKNDISSTQENNKTRFVTHIIAISVVSFYYFYIDIVRELFRAINCVEIDAATVHVPSEHPYRHYATEPVNHVWAEDTEHVCLEGSHIPVGIAGFIGLGLAFCAILCIGIWLPLNKRRLPDANFVSRYWFLYQGYKTEWYRASWESLILVRKTLIAAVVVLTGNLGTTMQAILSTGILFVAQSLHFLFSPFRTLEDDSNVPEYAGSLFRAIRRPGMAMRWVQANNAIDLNILESMALACSSLIYFAALILNEPGSSETVKKVTILFTFSINLTFILYVLYRLFAGLHLLLDCKLENKDPSFLARNANNMGVGCFAKKALFFLVSLSKSTTASSVERTEQTPVNISRFSQRMGKHRAL